MPLQSTSGAASYDAFGGGAAAKVNYIEDCFVSWLSTGNGTSRTVTGPDMTTGGLSITKSRSAATGWHFVDTARGAGNSLSSNTTAANASESTGVTAFTATGTSIGAAAEYNTSGATYVDYLLKKQPKFFDVVTYTGNGTARTISHSLGSVPACIIVKQTSAAGEDWAVYHRGLPLVAGSLNDNFLTLNTTSAYSTSTDIWNRTVPTSTVFSVGNHPSTNSNGASYVAYLFAHDAGGFGLTGTDNVISCGSFTTDGSANATVDLGYEPQWMMLKRSDGAGDWSIQDNMRLWTVGNSSGQNVSLLYPNQSVAENYGGTPSANPKLTNTGFKVESYGAGRTYIYIAIRRGPMKVPTSGTSVFTPVARSGTGSTSTVSNSITTDLIISMTRNTAGIDSGVWDRLRGITKYLATTGTATESTSSDSVTALNNTSYVLGADTATDRINRSGYTYANWNFRRAPSFFDEVCYTGTGVTHTETHNLGVAPELIIVKRRASATASWAVYAAPLTASYVGFLDLTNAFQADNMWNSTAPTSTAFTVRAANAQVNASGSTYVAYLFATCAGVSKVGSYTGTGTTKQVDCGFTGGARFVLIKRTDSTGDWYVWDSARGIVAGNDPYLLLNSTAAEVTNTDYIDTYSAGFEISSTAPAAINASGGTFIFLAIA